VGVAVFCLRFTILCFSTGQALNKIYCFLMQTQIWIQPKLSLYIQWIWMLENCWISTTLDFELCHTPSVKFIASRHTSFNSWDDNTNNNIQHTSGFTLSAAAAASDGLTRLVCSSAARLNTSASETSRLIKSGYINVSGFTFKHA